MNNWYLIGGAIALYYLFNQKGEGMANTFPNAGGRSRGLRNNNPGNIKETGTAWKGQIRPSKDQPFAQFLDMRWGARAMIIIVKRTYRNRGLKTIRQIIETYAPPSENPTGAYINAVSRATGINADAVLSTESDYKKVIQAMAAFENGLPVSASLPDNVYFEALNLI